MGSVCGGADVVGGYAGAAGVAVAVEGCDVAGDAALLCYGSLDGSDVDGGGGAGSGDYLCADVCVLFSHSALLSVRYHAIFFHVHVVVRCSVCEMMSWMVLTTRWLLAVVRPTQHALFVVDVAVGMSSLSEDV